MSCSQTIVTLRWSHSAIRTCIAGSFSASASCLRDHCPPHTFGFNLQKVCVVRQLYLILCSFFSRVVMLLWKELGALWDPMSGEFWSNVVAGFHPSCSCPDLGCRRGDTSPSPTPSSPGAAQLDPHPLLWRMDGGAGPMGSTTTQMYRYVLCVQVE